MRTPLPALLATLALALIPACGGNGDSGDPPDAGNGGGDFDASPQFDAPPAALSGLGEVCALASPMCPAEAPACVTVVQGATNGFCTLSCGTAPAPAPGQNPQPPADGNQICADAYNGSDGTPSCTLFGEAQNGEVPWACGILCGTLGETELGDCPAPLSCQSNLCLP